MNGDILPGWRISNWLLGGEWRAHPVRALVAIAAIALGIALGFAIHLINAAAFNEFSAAVKSLSGQADLQVRGAAPYFDEALFPRLAQRKEIALASPVLEVDAAVPGQNQALKLVGIDVFRAAAIAPALTGVPDEDRVFDTLADDAVFLSPAAMEWLKLKTGDTLNLQSGTGTVSLRVAGGIVRAQAGQRIAVMDIGALQWRFDRLGRLSRVDLRLTEGVDRAAFKNTLTRELGGGFAVTETSDQEARTASMSRAYRVNLNVLALVALFTGAFLVFSTQALSVIRRRSQLALLRVVGLGRRALLTQILLEGAVLGVIGSLLGLALGYAIAATALHFFGGDLGGGYFPGVRPSVRFTPVAAGLFFVLGIAVALLGCASPAWEAARAKPAQALKSGSEDVMLSRLSSPWPAITCLAAGALLTQMPPVFSLPIFGYLAVMLLLIGGIALMPRLAALVFAALSGVAQRGSNVVATLALARLANAPNQASIALGGVLSSFSLMVAMAIMVASFRVSVDDWLSQVLSADLYVQSATSGSTGALNSTEQQAIERTPGIARVDFLRIQQLTLDPARPSVALIARTIDVLNPDRTLPIMGEPMTTSLAPSAMPVWVSEAMVDLYGYTVGREVTLPLGGREHTFTVAGIWRDYARQSGAIQMRLTDYQKLTGDTDINDAGLWLQPGVSPEKAIAALKQLPFAGALKFSEPGEIRAISLKIFDRSFAVTYLLELVAIVIGLFGVAATFSAQTLARAKEFGMLRHVGVTRRQILAVLASEGCLLTALGIIVGFVLGWSISLILVFVVNPQSFHWTMQLHMPWAGLIAVAAVLLAAAGATALASGRYAVSGDAVRAVREDW
ncbi:MAG TPA: ABC transporter permease [Noviherbaspirillum sp.]|jgi:putative ABC transport system permease protein|uniref:ABC transporter permease n=1 Tax=Noviherbaspirillum sp. TaxID=1926288 RepID=UPI002DDD9FA8|nr:ABC transporter permease [Noviherbaspirillum sp.]HEV2611631.1 ABC transporter permease [Noviherbaspirillum sp.]